jgi:signal transduction histidine kinase
MRSDTRSSTPADPPLIPGGSSASAFQSPGLLVRVAPFAVVALLAEASLVLPPGPRSAWAVIVSVVLLLGVAAAFLLPWSRLPAWLPVIVPLAYTGSALALILAAGVTSGVGIVVLIPLVWTALFHRRWESACIVAAIVAVEVIISLTPVALADSVTARRVLLWALLGTLISVATHGLRDRIARSQSERYRLQEHRKDLTVIEDRERIAAALRDEIVQQIFAASLTLQGTAELVTDAQVRRRLDALVEDLDHVVRMIREAVFGLAHPSRPDGGLRQRIVALCSGLVPVPEISFSGQMDSVVPPQAQAKVVDLLNEILELTEQDCLPGRVEIASGEDSCVVVIDPTSRKYPDEAVTSQRDFSGLLEKAALAGIRMDIETTTRGRSVRMTAAARPVSPPHNRRYSPPLGERRVSASVGEMAHDGNARAADVALVSRT